jgi:hypothetical protein
MGVNRYQSLKVKATEDYESKWDTVKYAGIS